ncbi:MAG: hypothetical protein ABI775_13335 [Pseudonocardiales bacterium]
MSIDTAAPPIADATDHRGSPIPTGAMIATRFMELRRRRGLMVALALVTIGIPTVFLLVRLILHAADPKTYGPAGGYNIYTALTAGVLYIFGFIVAAALGATAGSVDLTDGMFRHLVITGRSRLALYLARIPAGLAIIVPLVAIGFSVVCAVCVFAAPKTVDYDGISLKAGMSQSELEIWAAGHADAVLCNLPSDNLNINVMAAVPCGNNGPGPGQRIGPSGPIVTKGPTGPVVPASQAEVQAAAVELARTDYADYHKLFTAPSTSLMIKTGLLIELETIVAFIVGLGLGSLIGQRTVAVIMMIILEIVLTPIFLRANIPHFINVQRAVIGVATSHLEPASLPLAFGGGGHDFRVPETTLTSWIVVVAWLVGWTGLGAWRMVKRDA